MKPQAFRISAENAWRLFNVQALEQPSGQIDHLLTAINVLAAPTAYLLRRASFWTTVRYLLDGKVFGLGFLTPT